MSNAEEGIARVQMASKDGLKQVHKQGVENLESRTSTYLSAIAFFGLAIVWMTATSPYVIYGSFVAAMLVVVLFGVMRVRRILKIREFREIQAKQARSESGS